MEQKFQVHEKLFGKKTDLMLTLSLGKKWHLLRAFLQHAKNDMELKQKCKRNDSFLLWFFKNILNAIVV